MAEPNRQDGTTVRRKRLLLDRFQLRLLRLNVGYFLVAIFLFCVAIFTPLVLETEAESVYSYEKQNAPNSLVTFHRVFWPSACLLLLLLSMHSVVVSHRIAGPLYRLRSIMRQIADRDVSTEVKLRRRDYLQADAKCLNETLAALRKWGGRLHAGCDETGASLERLRESVPETAAEDFRKRVEEAETAFSELQAVIKEFRISRESTAVAEREPSEPVATV